MTACPPGCTCRRHRERTAEENAAHGAAISAAAQRRRHWPTEQLWAAPGASQVFEVRTPAGANPGRYAAPAPGAVAFWSVDWCWCAVVWKPAIRMTDHVAETLLRARNLLATGRWCQGSLEDAADNVCAVGAIRNAARAQAMFYGAPYALTGDAARWQLDTHLPESYCRIEDFNDDQDTNLQDVLNLFDKTLADLGRAHEVAS